MIIYKKETEKYWVSDQTWDGHRQSSFDQVTSPVEGPRVIVVHLGFQHQLLGFVEHLHRVAILNEEWIKSIQPLSQDKVTMIFITSSLILISMGLVSKGKLSTHILGHSSVPSVY